MPLISDFDPWKGSLCSCPPKLSLSPYTGCSHGCLYCYASSYIPHFFQPRPKKNFLLRLTKEIKKIPPHSHLTIANSSDPYLHLERKLKLTRTMLLELKNYPLKISLVTKSTLFLRDLDILKTMKNVIICVSLTTLDRKLAKKIEPFAPSPQERFKAIKEVGKYIPVILRYDPIIYPLTDKEAEEILKNAKECGVRGVIVSTYKARGDNLKRMFSQSLRENGWGDCRKVWQKLYLEKGEKINGSYYLPQELRKEIILKVKNIAQKYKLPFSSCREGLEYLNTVPSCDGSWIFT